MIQLIFWIAFIFFMSSANGYVSHKESIGFQHFLSGIGFLNPLLHNLNITDPDFFIRKNAHAFEYIILSLLICTIVKNYKRKPLDRIAYTLFPCLLLAVLDEFHQSFVPGRGSLISDVLIDFCAAILGMLMFTLCSLIKASKITKHK